MAQVYASLIMKGVKTLNEVPEHLQSDVQAILDADA